MKGVVDLVGVDIQLSAQFTSPSVINIVVDYCEPAEFFERYFPTGATLQALKVF